MIHLGVVEGRKDPLALGRIQVRFYGIHTDKNTDPGILTEKLAWSTVMLPTTRSSNSGIGEVPEIVEGTMVVGMFNDESKQDAIILGTVPGLNQTYLYKYAGKEFPRGDPTVGFQDPRYEEKGWYPWDEYTGGTDKIGEENGKTDLPKGAVESQFEFGFERYDEPMEENPLFAFQEPEDLRKHHKYPHNQIRQSDRGHFEEWDNTYGNERINTQHRTGTFEEMRPDGTRVQKIVNEDYTIVSTNQFLHIRATDPHPRGLSENQQEPYTSDMWGWPEKNDTPSTDDFGKPTSGYTSDMFGRHVHIEGVDDLYVRRTRNVFVEGNTTTKIMGSDKIEIMGDDGQEITISGDQDINIGGSQEITIFKDQTVGIGQNCTVDIGQDHKETIGGDQIIHVLGDQTMTVGGNQSIIIKGDQLVHMSGNQTTTIGGSQTIGITNVDEEGADLGGVAQKISIAGNQSTVISGDQQISITGEQKVAIEKTQEININEGDQRIIVRDGNQKLSVMNGTQTMHVNGNQFLIATGDQHLLVTGGNQNISVSGDQMIDISGSQTVSIAAGGNQSFDVTAGNQEFSVTGNQTFSVIGTQNIMVRGMQQISADVQNIDILGAQIMNIGAAQTINVGGACTVTAVGAATVTAPTVAINAAATTISGTLTVGGLVTAPDFFATSTGITLATHTHPFVDGLGTTTTAGSGGDPLVMLPGV